MSENKRKIILAFAVVFWLIAAILIIFGIVNVTKTIPIGARYVYDSMTLIFKTGNNFELSYLKGGDSVVIEGVFILKGNEVSLHYFENQTDVGYITDEGIRIGKIFYEYKGSVTTVIIFVFAALSLPFAIWCTVYSTVCKDEKERRYFKKVLEKVNKNVARRWAFAVSIIIMLFILACFIWSAYNADFCRQNAAFYMQYDANAVSIINSYRTMYMVHIVIAIFELLILSGAVYLFVYIYKNDFSVPRGEREYRARIKQEQQRQAKKERLQKQLEELENGE